MSARRPRVSVIVPVYNPGRWIEPGIASVLGQTLPSAQVEAIFVDDGSTDGTADRLDRLAAEHPASIRVIHIPASGAPGRPRNVGIDAASGDYIQFLDADDELAVDALERVVAMADRNASDIVVEKFGSASLRRPQRLFQRNVERTTLAATPMLIDSSLALAKLFRTAFVRDHGLRFPEGWRLMEDQSFVLRGYARAGAISILADHACYFFHRRDDGGGHLTTEPLDPAAHIAHLNAILDEVDRDHELGPIRDRILRRLVRAELLARVGEPAYQAMPAEDRARLFAGGRDIVRDRIPERVIAELGAVARIRAELLVAEKPDELLTLAERMDDVDLATDLQHLGWRDGRLDVRAAAGLRFVDEGRPLVVRGHEGRTDLDPVLADDRLGHPTEVSGDLLALRAEFILRDRATALEWHVRGGVKPVRSAGEGSAETPVETVSTAVVDPLGVGTVGVALAPGAWDVRLRVTVFGVERSVQLGAEPSAEIVAACRPALVGHPARFVVPVFDERGLRLEVDPPGRVLVEALAGRPARVVRDGEHVTVELAMVSGQSAAQLPVALVVGTPDGERIVPARLRGRLGGVELEARPVGLNGLGAGPYSLALRVGGADIPLGSARVAGPSELAIEGLPRLTAGERAAAIGRWPLVRIGSSGAAFVAAAQQIGHRGMAWTRRRLRRSR